MFDLGAVDQFGVTLTSVGNDIITDFDVTNEVIKIGLDNANYDSFGELSIANKANGDAVVDLGAYGSITLTGVDASSLDADNFVFTDNPLVA